MKETIAYKVLSADEFAVLRSGQFPGSAVDRADGFIHLSTAGQLTETVDRHFSGQSGLMIVAVKLAAVGAAVRWEPSRDGQLFPHLYAPLSWASVIAAGPLERSADGSVRPPAVSGPPREEPGEFWRTLRKVILSLVLGFAALIAFGATVCGLLLRWGPGSGWSMVAIGAAALALLVYAIRRIWR